MNTIYVPSLSIEVTRRCNLRCEFCLRGEPENRNILYKYIDSLLCQVSMIDYLCITGGEPSLNSEAIQYIVDELKERDTFVKEFCIGTNGITPPKAFIKACKSLYKHCVIGGRVMISNDSYHYRYTDATRYDKSLLRKMSFCHKDFSEDGWQLPFSRIHKEGRYANSSQAGMLSGAAPITSLRIFERNVIYLNVNGHIVNGCDWSYESQEKHRLCKVENLTKYYEAMKDNKEFIEEDWEREATKEHMYMIERQMEEDEAYWQWWEEEQAKKQPGRKPASIEVVKSEYNEEEFIEKHLTKRRKDDGIQSELGDRY